jgi:dual specificity tyrosine-phosphorylation-regulated kinase 2/3/4
METMGLPPMDYINQASRRKFFFHSNGQPRIVPNSKGRYRRPNSKTLESVLKYNGDKGSYPIFIDFLKKCLTWRPEDRLTPEKALKHPWIRSEEVSGIQPDHY